MRTKPGPPQDSQAPLEELTECAAHQDEQKTYAEAAALAFGASCLYGWALSTSVTHTACRPMKRHASASRPCNVLVSGPRFMRHHAHGQDSSCPVGVPDCKVRRLCYFVTSRIARRNHLCKVVSCCTAVVAAGAAALLVGGCQLSSPLRDGLDRSCCQKASCAHMHHEYQHSRALRCQSISCQTLAAVHTEPAFQPSVLNCSTWDPA